MTRYVATSEDTACYCHENVCEETGRRANAGWMCSNCREHAKHAHCDEHHCIDERGLCDCRACIMCGEKSSEADSRYCSRECAISDEAREVRSNLGGYGMPAVSR